MPFDDQLRRIYVREHADAHARDRAEGSNGRRKEVPPDPRPFTHAELESYLEHFKTCKNLHFPDPQVRYYRKFARTCKLHADYICSFDNTRLIDICCGELIPYSDYLKFGDEENRFLLDGNHIPGLRHIYLELDEAFKTSRQRSDRRNFPANGFMPDEEEEGEKRLAKEKSIKEQAEIWARILAKGYEDDQARRLQAETSKAKANKDEEPMNEPSPKHRLLLLSRQRSETV